MSIQTKPSTRRPSGFPRQAMTIGGMMMIIAVIAFYAWCIQAATQGQSILPLLLGFAVGYPAIAGPLVVKSKQWITADPGFDPIDPNSDLMPQLVSDSIARTVPDLEGLGFEWRGTFSHLGAVANANAYVTLFEDPKARRTAQLFTVFGASALSRQVVTVLVFRSEFTDGTWLATGNSGVPSLFPRSDRIRKGTGSFPWIQDPYRLYQVHEASVAHYASDAIPAPQDTSDPLEFLRESVRREHAHFVEVGYVKLDERRGVYRYTWKGAILGAWKLTWPIKPIRLWLRRREAVRILREIGLESLAMGA
ncbi:MAG: hypothetical protein ACYC61_12280 [Isosphaeraceae bacterium]